MPNMASMTHAPMYAAPNVLPSDGALSASRGSIRCAQGMMVVVARESRSLLKLESTLSLRRRRRDRLRGALAQNGGACGQPGGGFRGGPEHTSRRCGCCIAYMSALITPSFGGGQARPSSEPGVRHRRRMRRKNSGCGSSTSPAHQPHTHHRSIIHVSLESPQRTERWLATDATGWGDECIGHMLPM
jgi:hypothetical protein